MPGSPTENTVIDTIIDFSNNFGIALNPNVSNPARDPSIDVGGKCAYTAQSEHFSKFAIGGTKALAIAGAGAISSIFSGGGGGVPPSLESISFGGVQTVDEEGNVGFGGIIIKEISFMNQLPTQTVQTGKNFELRLPFNENRGVNSLQHVAVYMNIRESDNQIQDSDTYLVYEKGKPLQIVNKQGIISSADVRIIERNAFDVDVIFDIKYAQSMPSSDVIVRAWNDVRRSSDFTFTQLIEVVESTDKESTSEIGTEESTDKESTSEIDTEDTSIPKSSAEEKQQDRFTRSISREIALSWGGYSGDSVSNNELLSNLGIEGKNIPSWYKKNVSKWIYQEEIGLKELMNAIIWMSQKGYIN